MEQKKVVVPTAADCKRLWEEYHTPAHIRRHCAQVGRVARWVAEGLFSEGIAVDVELCVSAGLLHDLVRVTEWKELKVDQFFDAPPSQQDIRVWEKQRARWSPHIPHAQVNAEILQKEYPELASVIAKHSVSSVGALATWEEKVVHYADRRVMHDTIVSVQERFADFQKRYPSMDPDGSLLKASLQLEDELFATIQSTPELCEKHV
jgi:HD superfamily phosphohydrolase YqeK